MIKCASLCGAKIYVAGSGLDTSLLASEHRFCAVVQQRETVARMPVKGVAARCSNLVCAFGKHFSKNESQLALALTLHRYYIAYFVWPTVKYLSQ